MKTLRQKLVVSYGLLMLVIVGVGVIDVVHFVRLGRAVDTILANNYKSIQAAEGMSEALERQDSAAVWMLAGQSDRARRQFSSNSADFVRQFEIAAHNITEPGEPETIRDIETRYSAYRQAVADFLMPSRLQPGVAESKLYTERIHPAYAALKTRLDDLTRIIHESEKQKNLPMRLSK